MMRKIKETGMRDKRGERGAVLQGFLELVGMIVVVVICYFGIRMFVVGTFEIPSQSMTETILVGDRVFSEKISYYQHSPQQGDIVTFSDPRKPEQTLIKRCIATAGQTVELRDGDVYVDGVALDEPYTRGKPSMELTPAPGVDLEYPYTVPEDCIWVMGDNRTRSRDSRWFGDVPVSSVTSRVVCTYWPPERIGPVS
jgi:signal peptidase I